MFIMQLLQRNYIASSADVEKEAARVVRDNKQALLEGKQIEFPFWLNNKYYSQGNEDIAQKFTGAVIKQMLSDAFIKAAREQGLEITPERLKAQIKYSIHNPFIIKVGKKEISEDEKAKVLQDRKAFIDNFISQTSGDNIPLSTLLAEMPKFIDKAAIAEQNPSLPSHQVGFQKQILAEEIKGLQSKDALYSWMSEHFDLLNFPSTAWRGTYVEKSFDKMREYSVGENVWITSDKKIAVDFRQPLSKQLKEYNKRAGQPFESIPDPDPAPAPKTAEVAREENPGPVAGLSTYSYFSMRFNDALSNALLEMNSTWEGAQISCASTEILIKYGINERNAVVSESFDSSNQPIAYNPRIFDSFETSGQPLWFYIPEWMGAGAAGLLKNKLKEFLDSQGINCDFNDSGRNLGPDNQYYYGFKAVYKGRTNTNKAIVEEVFPGEEQNPKITKIKTGNNGENAQTTGNAVKITVPETVTTGGASMSDVPLRKVDEQTSNEIPLEDAAETKMRAEIAAKKELLAKGLEAKLSSLGSTLRKKPFFGGLPETPGAVPEYFHDGASIFSSANLAASNFVDSGHPIEIFMQNEAAANAALGAVSDYITACGFEIKGQPSIEEAWLMDANLQKVRFYRAVVEIKDKNAISSGNFSVPEYL